MVLLAYSFLQLALKDGLSLRLRLTHQKQSKKAEKKPQLLKEWLKGLPLLFLHETDSALTFRTAKYIQNEGKSDVTSPRSRPADLPEPVDIKGL